jgi:hypothetical protein
VREMNIHHHLNAPPLPPIDDEYRASARRRPGEWVYYVDPSLPPEAPKVVANIIGGREVGADGEFTGEFWVNPKFTPQPATAGVRFSTVFEVVLWRLAKGYIDLGEFMSGFAEAVLLTPAQPGNPAALRFDGRPGSPPMLAVFSSPQYFPPGELHWRRITGREVIDTLGTRDDVQIVFNPDGVLGVEFTGAELGALWRQVQDQLARQASHDPK